MSEIEPKFSNTKVKRARARSAKRRQSIIDAARTRLVELGPSGLIMRDLSVSIGIARGNIQYYFATKDDLIVAIFEQEVERLTDSMSVAIGHASNRAARISTIIDTAVEVIRRDTNPLFMMLHSVALQNNTLKDILAKTNEKYDLALAENLLLINPECCFEQRLHIAQIIRMILDGFAIQASYDDMASPQMIALQGELRHAITKLLD